ncbi:MAG: methyltransferase domain-containing protein [Ferruginibacter sp.]|nr:methyltransferase domain-containing protein [Ferruginibacter sp.]
MESNFLDEKYWDERYSNHSAAWDIGSVSTPIKEYIDQLNDKSISILIPGCGNAYEAEYLIKQGFTNITVIDISPVLVAAIKQKFQNSSSTKLQVICGDFFKLAQQFDLILEQTFFCALDPGLRTDYAEKMHELLKPGGKLAGLLFNISFEKGPPFGGNKQEYKKLFSDKFQIRQMENCYNSIGPRKGNEIFIILEVSK